MKKKSGEVQQFFIQMICIIFSFVILLYAINFLSTTIAYNNINQMARKYILKMERKGYITTQEEEELETTLEDNGNIEVTDIDVSNSDEGNKAPFGDEITITISCKIKMKGINFDDFSFTNKSENMDVSVTKASTARW